MRVREIMTTELVTVAPSASIIEAARLMRDADIGDVLITADNRLVGIITDRDIVTRAVAEGLDVKKTRVEDHMTRNLFTGLPDWNVEDAADILAEEQIRRLPIVENGRPVGIVSLGDIAVQVMNDEITGETLEEISEPAMPRIGEVRT